MIYVPGSTVRSTNNLNFWTVSYANRWGFLDRPPPLLGPPAEPSCRVAIVGDSFVNAPEVAVSDKLQVRVEKMAASRMPTLRVAASGYGVVGSGQVAQLGLYDGFVSRTSPDIVVLVFVRNDFGENASVGPHPYVSATRRGDGTFELLPPAGARSANLLGTASTRSSYALPMLKALIMTSPAWRRARRALGFRREQDLGLGPDTLEYTGFALDQWKARARRDNFFLVIFASHTMGNVVFGPMKRLASARDIPVIDSNAYLSRQNHRARDGTFRNDHHWNRTGHQWAAEAFLEWLEQNQGACAGHPPAAGAGQAVPQDGSPEEPR